MGGPAESWKLMQLVDEDLVLVIYVASELSC